MKTFAAVVLALALMVAVSVEAHDGGSPGHKHTLEIDRSQGHQGLICTNQGGVFVHFKESTGECGGWGSNECSYTCLYQVWANWRGADGYQGRGTEPRGGYYKCHIMNSDDPKRAYATFYVPKPSWGSGKYGVYVRDGWNRSECRFN